MTDLETELVKGVVEEELDAVLDALVCVAAADRREDDSVEGARAEGGAEVLVLMYANNALEGEQHRDEDVSLRGQIR